MKLKTLGVCVVMALLAGCEDMAGKSDEKDKSMATTMKQDGAAPSASAASTKPPAAPAGPPLIDSVNPANQQEETAHGQKGEASETGDFNDRTYRHALNGWFSYDLKVVPDQPNDLVVTYWGSDQRTFDILIDGQKLVSERIANNYPEQFFDKTYVVPATMTKGKQKVTVRFENPESYAGGIFGVRMMRAGKGPTTGPAK